MVRPKRSKTRVIKGVCDSLGRLPAPPTNRGDCLKAKKSRSVRLANTKGRTRVSSGKKLPFTALPSDFLSILSPVAPTKARDEYLKQLQIREAKVATKREAKVATKRKVLVPPRAVARMMTRSQCRINAAGHGSKVENVETSQILMPPSISSKRDKVRSKMPNPSCMDLLAGDNSLHSGSFNLDDTKTSTGNSSNGLLKKKDVLSRVEDYPRRSVKTSGTAQQKQMVNSSGITKNETLSPSREISFKTGLIKGQPARKRSKLGYKILTRKRVLGRSDHKGTKTQFPQTCMMTNDVDKRNGANISEKSHKTTTMVSFGSRQNSACVPSVVFVSTDDDSDGFFDAGGTNDNEPTVTARGVDDKERIATHHSKRKHRRIVPMCSLMSLSNTDKIREPTDRKVRSRVSHSKSIQVHRMPEESLASTSGKKTPLDTIQDDQTPLESEEICQTSLNQRGNKKKSGRVARRQRRTLTHLDSIAMIPPSTRPSFQLSQACPADYDERNRSFESHLDSRHDALRSSSFSDSQAWDSTAEPLGLKLATMYAESTSKHDQMATRFRHLEFPFPMSSKEMYNEPITRELRKHLRDSTLDEHLHDLYYIESDEDDTNRNSITNPVSQRHRRVDIAEYGRRIRMWELLQQD